MAVTTAPVRHASSESQLAPCCQEGWELGKIVVALSHHKYKDGPERIEREISFGAELSDEQRARLAEIAEKTPVTKTVKAGAPIATRLL